MGSMCVVWCVCVNYSELHILPYICLVCLTPPAATHPCMGRINYVLLQLSACLISNYGTTMECELTICRLWLIRPVALWTGTKLCRCSRSLSVTYSDVEKDIVTLEWGLCWHSISIQYLDRWLELVFKWIIDTYLQICQATVEKWQKRIRAKLYFSGGLLLYH